MMPKFLKPTVLPVMLEVPNSVNSTKTLKKADLEKWEMNSTDKINKIIYQINNGKLAMAIFKARLKDDDLEGYRA